MTYKDYEKNHQTLNHHTARHLSHTTKTVPIMESITPRWFLDLLPWIAVDAGIYTVNKIRKCPPSVSERKNRNQLEEKIDVFSSRLDDMTIPHTFAKYQECPKEYILNSIRTYLKVNSTVTDIFNHPIDQLKEQMRLTIEAIKEKQEYEMINNNDYGLVSAVAPDMKIKPKYGPPTPDDMDELLAKVWKKPGFFLAHPQAIAAFGKECTKRGVPPATINISGSPFITWRGVPIVPCDKLKIDDCTGKKSNILLMRVGEKERGVVGLHQPGIPDETDIPSLNIKLGSIDHKGIAHYILSLYYSIAVLADDALGMLENVELGDYYEYQ